MKRREAVWGDEDGNVVKAKATRLSPGSSMFSLLKVVQKKTWKSSKQVQDELLAQCTTAVHGFLRRPPERPLN